MLMLNCDKRHAKELWNSELLYMAVIQKGQGEKSEALHQIGTTLLLFPCAFLAMDFICPQNILFSPDFTSFFSFLFFLILISVHHQPISNTFSSGVFWI